MAFVEKTVVQLVKARLGINDASQDIRITWAIPQALEQLARKVAANPRKRAMLMTVRESTEIELVSNAFDLEAYNLTAPKKLLIEYLHNGTLWFQPPEQRVLTVIQSFGGSFDLMYKAAHGLLDGEAFKFPSDLTGATPGPAFALDTTYYAFPPTQAELNATGFLDAVPADYFKIATSLANAVNRTAADITLTQPSLTIRTNGGDQDAYPLRHLDLSMVNSIENHPLYGNYRFFVLDGPKLRAFDFDKDGVLVGSIHFAVPYQPTLTQLAAITELHGEFIEKMFELCAAPGNDSAEDGEH